MTSLALLTDFALHFPPAIPDLLHGPLYAALRRAGFLRLVSDLVFLTTCHALAILTSSTCAHLLSPLQGSAICPGTAAKSEEREQNLTGSLVVLGLLLAFLLSNFSGD